MTLADVMKRGGVHLGAHRGLQKNERACLSVRQNYCETNIPTSHDLGRRGTKSSGSRAGRSSLANNDPRKHPSNTFIVGFFSIAGDRTVNSNNSQHSCDATKDIYGVLPDSPPLLGQQDEAVGSSGQPPLPQGSTGEEQGRRCLWDRLREDAVKARHAPEPPTKPSETSSYERV